MNEHVADAIFAQPSLKGNRVICPNNGDEDTPLDLELLFTAVVSGKAEAINNIINGQEQPGNA